MHPNEWVHIFISSSIILPSQKPRGVFMSETNLLREG